MVELRENVRAGGRNREGLIPFCLTRRSRLEAFVRQEVLLGHRCSSSRAIE